MNIFKFNFSVNDSFEQTVDNYLSHSSEIEENDINLAIKLCNEDKYVKERLSTLKISSRYNSTQNRTDICKFIKDAESSRYLWFKTIENVAIIEDKDKEIILNTLSPFLSREIYQSRKFMNIEKGKFKADISSMFQDYIEGFCILSSSCFADNVEEIAKAGIKAIIQPGGQSVIKNPSKLLTNMADHGLHRSETF